MNILPLVRAPSPPPWQRPSFAPRGSGSQGRRARPCQTLRVPAPTPNPRPPTKKIKTKTKPQLGAVNGFMVGLLWKGFESYNQQSKRNTVLVSWDYLKTKLFGRDVSSI